MFLMLLLILLVVPIVVLVKIAKAKGTVKNANGFAEYSLLPDEKIVAKAEFHPLRDCLAPILFYFFTFLFFNLAVLHLIPTHLLDDPYRIVDGVNIIGDSQLRWDESTGELCINQGDEEWKCTHPKMDYLTVLDEIEKRGLEEEHVWLWKTSPVKRNLFFIVNILLFFGLYFLIRWINSKNEFVITSKRVIAKVGVIRRIAFELQTEQVESIEIYQGIFGRLFKYGTLMPCGIGASKVRVRFVVNPFEFRQHFYNLKKNQNN